MKEAKFIIVILLAVTGCTPMGTSGISIPCPSDTVGDIQRKDKYFAEGVLKTTMDTCHPFASARLAELQQQEDEQGQKFRASNNEAQRKKEFDLFCRTTKKNDYLKKFAKSATESNLKAPATAKFSPINVRKTDPKNDSCKYLIEYSVDAQNSFGALVRSNYTVILTYYRDKGLVVDAVYSQP